MLLLSFICVGVKKNKKRRLAMKAIIKILKKLYNNMEYGVGKLCMI